MRRLAACLSAIAFLFQSSLARAQDSDTVGVLASTSESRPLVLLPNPPTPSPLKEVKPASVHPALPGGDTVSHQTTLSSSSASEARSAINGRAPFTEEIGGIVTDDAITLIGQDFYSAFAQAWTQMPLSERYLVSVHERPSARYGSLIWVEYQQRRVFQAFLPIARANVRPIAENAAAVALQTVMQADIANLLFHDVDLGSDEM